MFKKRIVIPLGLLTLLTLCWSRGSTLQFRVPSQDREPVSEPSSLVKVHQNQFPNDLPKLMRVEGNIPAGSESWYRYRHNSAEFIRYWQDQLQAVRHQGSESVPSATTMLAVEALGEIGVKAQPILFDILRDKTMPLPVRLRAWAILRDQKFRGLRRFRFSEDKT
jgi:hypothetical protein